MNSYLGNNNVLVAGAGGYIGCHLNDPDDYEQATQDFVNMRDQFLKED